MLGGCCGQIYEMLSSRNLGDRWLATPPGSDPAAFFFWLWGAPEGYARKSEGRPEVRSVQVA